MIAKRSGSLSLPQPAISFSVRPHPMQSPVWPLTAQTLMHGLEGFGGSMRHELTIPPPLAKHVASVILFFDKLALTFDAAYRKSIFA